MTAWIRSLAVAALALGACACGGSDAPAEDAAPPAEAPVVAGEPGGPGASEGGLALEGGGLRFFSASGAARPIPFGTQQAVVLNIVAAVTGATLPAVQTNAECGAGPVQFATFPGGLQLLFQDDKFAGWFLREPGLTTVDGVGVGTGRTALDASGTVTVDPDSTLGVEFSRGELGGILSAAGPDGRVESLYAGLTCFFR